MASLDMKGPYSFNREKVNEIVTRTTAGNYALGYLNEKNTFIVQYVGRADSDVRGRLLQHVGEDYSHFKYSYAISPKDAFEKECKNYHDFGENKKLKNEIHPDRPSNSKAWKCPVCEIYD